MQQYAYVKLNILEILSFHLSYGNEGIMDLFFFKVMCMYFYEKSESIEPVKTYDLWPKQQTISRKITVLVFIAVYEILKTFKKNWLFLCRKLQIDFPICHNFDSLIEWPMKSMIEDTLNTLCMLYVMHSNINLTKKNNSN